MLGLTGTNRRGGVERTHTELELRWHLHSKLTGVNSETFGYNADDELSTESYDADGNTIATGGRPFAYDSGTCNHLQEVIANHCPSFIRTLLMARPVR
jgi:hypothetical protein